MIAKLYTLLFKLLTFRSNDLPVSLRSDASERSYQKEKKKRSKKASANALENAASLREWKHWRLIENRFPYDYAYERHHLLIPKRVVKEEDLSTAERTELARILRHLSDSYSAYMVNFTSLQSIRGHYHVHLLTFKKDRSEMIR